VVLLGSPAARPGCPVLEALGSESKALQAFYYLTRLILEGSPPRVKTMAGYLDPTFRS